MQLLYALALAGLVRAQAASSASSSAMSALSSAAMSAASSASSSLSPTMSSSMANMATAMPGTPLKINVGSPSGNLVFEPETVMAPMGAQLEFHFYPMNHSVVSGPFDNACQPAPSNAINSGFVPAKGGESPTTFTVTVNSTDPMWLYCSQEGHCQKGMVMVVNPPAMGNTLDMYKQAAAKASNPGTPVSVMGGIMGMASGTTPGSTPMATPGSGGSGGSGSGSGSGSSASPQSTGAAARIGAAGAVLGGAVAGAVGLLL